MLLLTQLGSHLSLSAATASAGTLSTAAICPTLTGRAGALAGRQSGLVGLAVGAVAGSRGAGTVSRRATAARHVD